MKTAIMWILAIAALYIGITAFQMHEYVICGSFAAMAVLLVWLAPSGKDNKKSKRTSRGSDRDMEPAGRW
jgi:hypothetical protein